MSTTVKLTSLFEADIGGEIKSDGSLSVPVEITAASDVCLDVKAAVTNAVADAAGDYQIETLWTTGDAGITDFNFLWAKADADCLLELRSDDATDEFMVIELKAGVPFIMPSTEFLVSDSGASPLTEGSAVTLYSCDQINVMNHSALATTVNIRLVLIT
jgi:hypothetical protein